MVSLNNLCLGDEINTSFSSAVAGPLDLETEQLISEIEQLTSRALMETNQWGVDTGGDGGGNLVILENNSYCETTATASTAEAEVSGGGGENNNTWLASPQRVIPT